MRYCQRLSLLISVGLLGCGPKTVKVPNVVGKILINAQNQLVDIGLKGDISGSKSKAAIVKSIEPPAGTMVKKGATVTLIAELPSDGPVIVPNVVGKTVGDARKQLENKALQVQSKGSMFDDAIVKSTEPPAGTVVKKGTTVNLITVSDVITYPPPPDKTQEPPEIKRPPPPGQ